MNNALITVLLNMMLITGIWWLLFIEMKSYRLDLSRQKLFNIRDTLFKNAPDRDIPYDSDAYTLMRTTINGMIQFTHKLSFIRLITILVIDKKLGGKRSSQFDNSMAAALENVSPDNKRYLENIRKRMHVVILRHIAYSSIFLSTVVTAAIFLRSTKYIAKAVLLGGTLSAVDAEAKYVGTGERRCSHTPAHV